MLPHGDNCRHCRGKMSAPKPVLDGPHIGQTRMICTKCGHIEYQRSNADAPPHRVEAEFTNGDRAAMARSQIGYRRAAPPGTPPTHASAVAALARNDHAAAIDEYRKVVESHPDDALAYSEISRVACEHLGDATVAAAALEEALSREWPQDDAALLCMRLADVYWYFQHDPASSRALLVQIKETMPGTQHARDAQKRLHEIHEHLALQSRQ